nr:DUF4238 domain-containing protein [uncultured Psychrobacter sp.]
MKKIKTANHHWWPICVSKHWRDETGHINRMQPNGAISDSSPKNLGVIKDAHNIKLKQDKDTSSSFDTSFEYEFDTADSNFPNVIKWLESLTYIFKFNEHLEDRFVPQTCTKEDLNMLTECAVSLAVRSPQNREGYVSLIESVGGEISSHKAVEIKLNMIRKQREIVKVIKDSEVKFAVLYSNSKEFIYGDGFFTNIVGNVEAPSFPYMVVPITPDISVVMVKPSSYKPEIKLSTLVLKDTEIEACNHTIQIYSKKEIFYKSHKPNIHEDFRCDKHLRYVEIDNPMSTLINSMPGISSFIEL